MNENINCEIGKNNLNIIIKVELVFSLNNFECLIFVSILNKIILCELD